jgi:hypothetical protein
MKNRPPELGGRVMEEEGGVIQLLFHQRIALRVLILVRNDEDDVY